MTGYVRDRAAEFARRDVSRGELLAELEAARVEVGRALAALEGRPLPTWYPEVITEMHVETEEFLMHLVMHFGYHLGQIDTHRRIVTGQTANVGALRPAELASARPAR
jgi:AMMECR1 domain-containing protein